MFPVIKDAPIEVKLANHVFAFRRLTWREEVAFSKKIEHPRRLDYTAFAMTTVDGKVVDYLQASAILKAMPKSITERIVTLYLGSLPKRRLASAVNIYVAPDPVPYRDKVAIEEDQAEDQAESELVRQFGREEVAEAEAQAALMARNTNYAGAVTPAQPPGPPAIPAPAAENVVGLPQPPREGELEEGPVVYHFEAT